MHNLSVRERERERGGERERSSMAPKSLQFPIVSATADDERPQETSVGFQETAAAATIHLLPDPILENILFRVPAKTVSCCKTVCKPWLGIIGNPMFARSHFSRAPVCPLFLIKDKLNRKRCRIVMQLVEGETVSDLDPRNSKSKLISRIEFSELIKGTTRIKGADFLELNFNAISCEGLVCWVWHDHPHDPILICNPITGEYLSFFIPPVEKNHAYVFIGLGFCRAPKKFELLRMSGRVDYDDDTVIIWSPEVRTVGERCWRPVGNSINDHDLSLLRTISQVVYVNEAIYWSYIGDSIIYSFNFDRAILQVIPLPKMKLLMVESNSIASESMRLGVLANSLCVSLVSPDDGHVELWISESCGASGVQWNKLCDVETTTTYLEHRGTLWHRGQYKAIKYLCNGEILMHDWRGTLLIYDPMTKKERQFCVLQDSCLQDLVRNGFDALQVVPHVPCLVKLKETLNAESEGDEGILRVNTSFKS